MQIWSNNFLVWSMEAKWKINLIITAFVGAPAHHQSNAMKSWWCNISQMWFICTKQKVPYFESLPLHSVHTSTYLDSSFSHDTEHSHVSATCDCAVLSSSRLCLLPSTPPLSSHASIFLDILCCIFFMYIPLVCHSFLPQSFWGLTFTTGSYCYLQHLTPFSLCPCGGDTLLKAKHTALSAGCTGLAVGPPSSRWHMHPWLVSRQFYHCTLHIIVVSTI